MKKINFLFKRKIFYKNNKKFKINFFYSKKKIPISMVFNEQSRILSLNKILLTSVDNIFDRWITLTIPAQEANLLPPLGPLLGQHGFNAVSFCSLFNETTNVIAKGSLCKVLIKLFIKKTFIYKIHTPTTSFLLYSALHYSNNKFTYLNLFKIGIIKKIDLPSVSILNLCHSIIGSAKSANLLIN